VPHQSVFIYYWGDRQESQRSLETPAILSKGPIENFALSEIQMHSHGRLKERCLPWKNVFFSSIKP